MDTVDRPPPRATSPVRTRWAAGLAMACHPAPVVVVTVLTAALAVTAGHSRGRCLLIAAAVLAGQLSVGWCNDAFDARRDRAVGRRDKPVVTGALGESAAWAAAFVALALCMPLSLACGPLAGTVHLAGVAAAWAYNLRLKATPLSWLPYALGFASLPAFVSLSLPGRPWPVWWSVAAAALLGVGAHLADVLPDIRGDLATGVRGLPHRLGATVSKICLPLLLVAATAVLVFCPPGAPGGAAVLASGAVVLMAGTGLVLDRRWDKAPFVGAVAVAVVDMGLLVARGTTIT